MLEQITYNEVCIINHQGLENMETLSSRLRLIPQDQDFYFKTNTIFHVLSQGASIPRPRSRDYIPANQFPFQHISNTMWKTKPSKTKDGLVASCNNAPENGLSRLYRMDNDHFRLQSNQ